MHEWLREPGEVRRLDGLVDLDPARAARALRRAEIFVGESARRELEDRIATAIGQRRRGV